MKGDYPLRWNLTGRGVLVIDDVGTPLSEMVDRAAEAHIAFFYWLELTESFGEVEDVFV